MVWMRTGRAADGMAASVAVSHSLTTYPHPSSHDDSSSDRNTTEMSPFLFSLFVLATVLIPLANGKIVDTQRTTESQ